MVQDNLSEVKLEVAERKSLDKIFEEVKDHDLVIVPEKEMADALNSRIEHAVLGDFSVTPKQLIYNKYNEEDFRQRIFIKLVEEKNMSWRQASYLLQNVLDCWKSTGRLDKIKEFKKFKGEEIETVLNVLKTTSNPFEEMEQYEISREKKVAVVQPEWLQDLEKQVLPEEYDVINIFSDKKTVLEEFKLFESSGQLIQSLKENIDRCGHQNTGIVVSKKSSYLPIIKSLFEAEGIPFISKDDLSADNDLRTLINLVRIGLSRKNVRVKDVRPIIEELDYKISRNKDNKSVSETEGLEEFKQFFNVLEYLEYREVIQKYNELAGRDLEKVQNLLKQLNMLNRTVSLESISNLEYFLDSFRVKDSETSEGVLIADPDDTSFIDRSAVFFIGISTEWTKEIETKPWKNREKLQQKNQESFNSLIQSGSKQIYMVQDMEMNRDITPCFHLHELSENSFSNFRELRSQKYEPEKSLEKNGFKKKKTVVKTKEIETLSQSRLNSLALSPRLYYFEKLVSDAEDKKIKKGDIFHDYAEFHINYPSFVEELGEDKIIKMMKDYMEPYVEELEFEKLETELRIGLRNIQNFLKNQEIQETDQKQYKKTREDKNFFSKKFNKPIKSKATEISFRDKELGAKGKIDLLVNETHMVDYKSGKKHNAKQIVEASNPETFENVDWPDFQPIMYLTYQRKQVPNKKLEFTFLNFLHNIEQVIKGEPKEEDNRTTITYHPETFDQKITELEVYEHLLKSSGKTSYQNKMLRKLGCPSFRKFFQKNRLEHYFSKQKLLNSQTAKDFKEYCIEEVGDYKYVKKGSEQTLKSLIDYRKTNYFKEDLDRFEQFLQQKIRELNRYKQERFPLKADPDNLPKRDMMLK